jgi:hypothetical protein
MSDAMHTNPPPLCLRLPHWVKIATWRRHSIVRLLSQKWDDESMQHSHYILIYNPIFTLHPLSRLEV